MEKGEGKRKTERQVGDRKKKKKHPKVTVSVLVLN